MKSFRMKLELKLLIFTLLISVIPIVIINFLWFNSSRKQIINATSERLSIISSDIAHQTDSYFQVKEIGSIIHSQTDSMLHLDIPNATNELKVYMLQDSDIEELSLLDASGKEVIRMNRSRVYTQDELVDQSSSNAYKIPLAKGGEKYISPLFIDKDGNPGIYVAIPIVVPRTSQKIQNLTTTPKDRPVSPNEVIGVLKANYSLRALWQETRSSKIGKNGYIFIVDESGNVIAHPNPLLERQQKSLRGIPEVNNFLASVNKAESLTPAVSQTKNELGELALTTHYKVLATNWGVVAQIPISDTLYETNQIGLFAVALLLAMVTGLGLLSLVFSKKIVRPIEELQEGSHLIGLGNLDYRLQIKSGDEIEQLGDAFNLMITRLQDSFNKLEDQKVKADKAAELLLRRDLDMRNMNDEIEKEKETIVVERNKLSFVLSGISDGVIAVDTEQNIILFNSAAGRITGYSASEVIGKRVGQVVRLYDGDNEIYDYTYCPIRADGFEGTLFSRDNIRLKTYYKEIKVNFRSGQLKEGPAVNLGGIITFHDVSGEKELEEMKLDFVSMAAHELRTPLTAIKGYLYVFLRTYSNLFNEEQLKYLKRISISTQKLVELVENLLNVTRIERGALSLKKEEASLLDVLERVINDFRDEANDKGVELSLEKNQRSEVDSKIMLEVDSLRISEVLSNLIENAITYTPKDGKISVWVEDTGKEVITHIRDTGEGIPREALPHLFTKFFRVSGKLESGSKGTGLGLYIAKAIIEMHQGKIWVESEENKGSTFSFSLPKP